MATSRLSLLSRARYTSPIPPLPSKAVISYDPSCWPICSDMFELRHCTEAQLGDAMKFICLVNRETVGNPAQSVEIHLYEVPTFRPCGFRIRKSFNFSDSG